MGLTALPDDASADDLPERDRGIFTETDRLHLWGLKEYDTDQARYQANQRIRERTVDGILDLYYLTMLQDKDRERIRKRLEEESGFRPPYIALTQFLYVLLDGEIEWFEEAIRQGVARGEEGLDTADRYGMRDVEVNIDVRQGYNITRLKRELESGNVGALSPAEIGVLVREGEIDSEDLEQLEYS